ncbi:hypothetical protein CLM71_22365 [Serratia sp. MYb239]|nr:hypothetical protein CLM71_22365 [Serratia sp. MYb239]
MDNLYVIQVVKNKHLVTTGCRDARRFAISLTFPLTQRLSADIKERLQSAFICSQHIDLFSIGQLGFLASYRRYF